MLNEIENLHSIGHAAQLLQLMPGEISRQAQALGIVPRIRLNGIDHFDERDLQKIREHLAKRRAKSAN